MQASHLRSQLLSQGYDPIPIDGKAPRWDGWSSGPITEDRLREVAELHPDHGNTGLRTGRLCIVDIDLEAPEHADAIADAITAVIGDSLFRRVGRKGFALLYFNAAPISKITVSAKPPGAKLSRVVEFLGRGQQVAAYGEHPDTGRPYEWPNADLGFEPLATPLHELPAVTPDLLRKAAMAVAEKLGELGYTDAKVTGDVDGTREEAHERPANGKPVSADIVESMLRHVSPDCDRNAWIKVAAGIKFAPVPDPDFDGLDLFVRWSAGELTECREPPPNYVDAKDCAKTWSDLRADKHGGAGFGSLVQIAIAGGYRGPVDSVFDSYDRPPAPAGDDEDLYPAFTLGELDNIPDPVWLIRDVLAEESLGMTFGATGSLKTFLELDKALWAAAGRPWAASEAHHIPGFKVERPVRTVLIAGEGARGLKRRIAAWGQRHEVDATKLPVLVVPVMPQFALAADVDKLVRTVRAKLPRPDHVVVDTAMWAASGLNLNVPADSQQLLSAFKRVMAELRCSLTFVHHTGKDKERGHLGAENLMAGVDVVDRVDLVETGAGRRKVRVANQKMKDGELRPELYLEATTEPLGVDDDGRPVSSLVLRRCHTTTAADEDRPARGAPYEPHALGIIEENKGKMPLTTHALATTIVDRMTRAIADMSDGEHQKQVKTVAKWLQRAAEESLAKFAWREGRIWYFGHRQPKRKAAVSGDAG